MKTYLIKNSDGQTVMTVDANTPASAKFMAKRQGWTGFCTAEEAETVSSIPGKEEYERFLRWKTACDNIAAEDHQADRKAARDILGSASGLYTAGSALYPSYPLTADETELAKQYARFLGDVAYGEFLRETEGR